MLETQPRQYSMVWIAWCMKMSAKSACCREGGDISRGHRQPHPTTKTRLDAPHLGIRAVAPALHILRGGVDRVPSLLPLQQRLLFARGQRLHRDSTSSETSP